MRPIVHDSEGDRVQVASDSRIFLHSVFEQDSLVVEKNIGLDNSQKVSPVG